MFCWVVVTHVFRCIGAKDSMETFNFTSDSNLGQDQAKVGLNKIKSLNTKFYFETCLFCLVSAQDTENVLYFDAHQLDMPKNGINNIINLVLTLLRIFCPQARLFFIIRYADDTESIGIEITGTASVACVILISATFPTISEHCVS